MRRFGTLAIWVALLASAAAHAEAASTVPITLVPGVTMVVPTGWAACDPAARKLLGRESLPDGITEDLCDPARPRQLVLIDPDPAGKIIIEMHLDTQHPLKLDVLRSAAPEMVEAAFCGALQKQMAGSEIVTCEAKLRSNPAAAMIFTKAVYMDAMAVRLIHIVWLPYRGGTLKLYFWTAGDTATVTDAKIDALIASLAVAPE